MVQKRIKKAINSCKNSGYSSYDQFIITDKLIIGRHGNKQKVVDYKLSRYACYLIAQNGDSRKKLKRNRKK